MSPTRRQLIAGLFGTAASGSLAGTVKALEAERPEFDPCDLVIVGFPESRNRASDFAGFVHIAANGDVYLNHPDDSRSGWIQGELIQDGLNPIRLADLLDRILTESTKRKSA